MMNQPTGQPFSQPFFQPIPAGAATGMPVTAPAAGQLPVEQSYIENILRLNLGKTATVYMTFENNSSWNAQIFRGVLEAAGRDHIIISDPANGKRYLLLMVNLDYITFDEPLNYAYPFA
jgi:spore germination protein Q